MSYGRRKGGVYVCSAARRKGRAVCASELHLPAAEILDRLERELLNANVFGEVLDIAVERLIREAPETSSGGRSKRSSQTGSACHARGPRTGRRCSAICSTGRSSLACRKVTVPCEAQPNPWGVLGGILSTKLASPISASWNQLCGWLRAVDRLRRAA